LLPLFKIAKAMTQENLIQKYNVPAPRYTSYPTVPFWDQEVPEQSRWMQVVRRTFEETNQEKGISLYLHLPFCESLCTYCGCNTRITKNHSVEQGYIDLILQEWEIYLQAFPRTPIIRELHLGGGTPTFFSPANLRQLLMRILDRAVLHPDHEMSFEGHPNNTSREHLQELYDLGFRRVSFGIQDFDEKVQRTINRLQPFENVQRVTEEARSIGYTSVNYDLIYGLPFQTLATVAETIQRVAELRPDRIAFYSYAHVPWIKPGQRGFSESDLPDNAEKRSLYELGLTRFKELGYTDIGMDHFALPGDALYQAFQEKKLHRNFMGYTTCQTDLLIGLGTSSISDAKYAYLQNQKKLEDYRKGLAGNNLPILKGHFLTEQDAQIREAILQVACKGVVDLDPDLLDQLPEEAREELVQMEREGIISLAGHKLQVTEQGKAFTRNICMVFDLRLREKNVSGERVFSKAI
jgi:oxygen-independent coproporphyrinogen III oxidase